MAVNLSPVGGVAAQFFDNSGNPLSGGKLYTYAAGTTTPTPTYTSSNGSTAHSNPIVLDAAGRVPAGGEIWLTDGINYKFVLKTSTDTLIATYDNITGINSNAVSYTASQEIQTATAGQTVFTLANPYQPGTNNLSVFVDGVNQYGPGAQYSYVETDTTTVTFNNGLHVGASVKFTTAQQQGAGAVSAAQVSYTPAGTGAVTTNVQAKLRQTVSAKDFGAVGDGVTDDTAALQAFFNACQNGRGYIPPGIYNITSTLNLYPQYSYNIEGSVFRNTSNAGTVIKNLGTGTAIFINNMPYTPPNFDSQIRLANLTVTGNSGSQHGIFADHAMIYLENVWLNGHGAHGLFLQRAYASAFKQVTCANNYKYGALISTAGNLIHFDHCVFNGNSMLDGYAGMRCTSIPDPLGDNFGIVFTSCDFTGNGSSPGVTTAIGAQVQRALPVSFIGCYWEGNKSANLYADSSAKNLTVSGCFFQDAPNTIANVDGLVYENNFHLQVSGTMQVNIDGGMPTARLPARMFGNTYYGGATPNPQAGVTENIQLWYTSPPSGGTWKRGDIVWNSAFQNGGGNHGWVCIVAGTPGTWIALGQVPYVYANWGDMDATLTPFASFPTNLWRSPLTTNRTVTLSSTNAVSGVKFRVTRTTSASGASTLDVGGLKSLAAGQWCDVEWDGSVWILTAFGSL